MSLTCPVSQKTNSKEENKDNGEITIVNFENQFESSQNDFSLKEEEEYKNLKPNEKEYRKLKRTMANLKKFYIDGTKAKKSQADYAKEQLEKIDFDLKMVKDQLDAMEKSDAYTEHLKQKEYTKTLKVELDILGRKKTQSESEFKHYNDLHLWSTQIVKICEWLDLNLEEYCIKNLKISVQNPIKVPELTKDEKYIYSKGLDEIMHNLTESQDFFEAAVDGRLLKYQYMEVEIIKKQIEVLSKYPKDNKRRQFVEQTLIKDLRYAQQRVQSGESESEQLKRKKSLEFHREFLKLLTFFRKKWNLLNEELGKVNYDPKFSKVFIVDDNIKSDEKNE